MRKLAYLLALVLFAIPVLAQSAPAPLPGYTVQIAGGYSNTQGNSNSGTFISLAVPIWTHYAPNTVTLSARADNYFITSTSSYVVTAGPEFRYQFSRATVLNGAVFQPFANMGLGEARSSCVSAGTCAPTQDMTSHFAFKVGGGLDMVLSSNTVARLFEVNYIHSTVFPGGHVTMDNFAELSAGIGFRF